jgi:hypothetical protein
LSIFRPARPDPAYRSPTVYSDLSYDDYPEKPRRDSAAKRRKFKNKKTTGNMFKRSFRSNSTQVADPQHRVDKSARLTKRSGGSGGTAGSVRDPQKLSRLERSLAQAEDVRMAGASQKSLAPSPIVTITVGREGRLFAAHEDVLCQSPYFEVLCRGQYLGAQGKRISLPEEEPEVFSAVLEYLYKGDYYPRLLHNKHRNSWELEDSTVATGGQRTPHASPNPTIENGGGRAAGCPSRACGRSSTGRSAV